MAKGNSSSIAIIHDYLVQMGGAEYVVATLADALPEASIYTSAMMPQTASNLFDLNRVKTSWMQLLPKGKLVSKLWFFLYPFAFLSLRPSSDVDFAWISCSTFSKFVRFPRHVCAVLYIHSPTRFLWDDGGYFHSEVSSGLLRFLVSPLFPLLRWADKRAASKYRHIIANSFHTKQNILNAYGLDSLVIYPPVGVSEYSVSATDRGYYLIVSRLVACKRIDLVLEAFANTERKLCVVGDGSDARRLRSIASANVHFTGPVSFERLKRHFAECRALIFPGNEDFGITPVEAQACGKPVLAFAAGGALETVVDGKTGVFFKEQTAEALLSGLVELENAEWDPHLIRKNAERFDRSVFLKKMLDYFDQISSPVSY